MRRFLPFILLLTAPVAITAAPVPGHKLTTERTAALDRLWAEARSDPVAEVKLACDLLTRPAAATEYLRGRLKPFRMTEERAKELIRQLDGHDEREWWPAFEELRTYDPRLAITVPEAWAEAKTAEQQTRLAAIWYYGNSWHTQGEPPDMHADFAGCNFTLENNSADRHYMVWRRSRYDANGSGSHISITFEDGLADHQTALDRRRVRLGLQTLAQVRTPAADEVIERMAGGHPDAGPTKDAKAVLAGRKKTPVAGSDLKLLFHMSSAWEQPLYYSDIPAGVALWLNHPTEAVRFLKVRMRPPRLEPERAKKLLADLFADDEQVWKAAFEELLIMDLRLAMPFEDAWNTAETPQQKVRLKWLTYRRIEREDEGREYHLKKESGQDRYVLWRLKRLGEKNNWSQPDGQYDAGYGIHTYQEVMAGYWYREKSAIYILDAIGTDDALAIIQDMATGHPDAGPTKAALAVLKRRGK